MANGRRRSEEAVRSKLFSLPQRVRENSGRNETFNHFQSALGCHVSLIIRPLLLSHLLMYSAEKQKPRIRSGWTVISGMK